MLQSKKRFPSRDTYRSGILPILFSLLIALGATASPADHTDDTDAGPKRQKPFTIFRHFRPDADPAKYVVYEDVKPLEKTHGIRPLVVTYADREEQQCKTTISLLVEKYDNCPISFDIEKNIIPRHMRNLVLWAHEAEPDAIIGHYAMPNAGLVPCGGLNDVVDVFFPSLYITKWNQKGWENRARQLVRQARHHNKPVYIFIMPKIKRTNNFLPVWTWRSMLETARDVGADGVVIWGASKSWMKNGNAPWWKETLRFAEENHRANQAILASE